VHVANARLTSRRLSAARAGYSCGLALLLFLFGSNVLQNAVAEGDTRTITMHHLHTGEDITITFKRDGRYDDDALEKLNWFLRDWRKSQETRMDPHLIDLIWDVQRESGSKDPIQVVCGYRSPETNAMLRRRSNGVARFSQHMLGHAMDFYIPGIPLEKLREIGLRMQRGGVGFYPTSGSPFVHMDTGSIRHWPRMTREELVRVFPDGRTVHIPTDGKPLPGYALALADIRKRGAVPSDNSLEAARGAGVNVDTLLASNDRPRNPFARLLGLGKNDDDEDADNAADNDPPPVAAAAPLAPQKPALIAAIERTVGKKPTASSGTATAAQAAGPPAMKVAAATPPKAAASAPPMKTIHVASLLPPPAAPAMPAPEPVAATPNDVIAARGYWQGPADAGAAKPAHPAEVTGSVTPFADRKDHSAPGVALAYADTGASDAGAAAVPTGIAALRAAAMPAQGPTASGTVVNSTTIAVKRAATEVASAIVTASATSLTVIKNDANFGNPWLRAIVLSPSVHHFLTTVALGASDFRSLAALMVKPTNAVMMNFAADPNPGLDHEHFSGAAIVFVSTVRYPTRTAALR
jgi:uncharacterized protein YcbK (DUF882 family)